MTPKEAPALLTVQMLEPSGEQTNGHSILIGLLPLKL